MKLPAVTSEPRRPAAWAGPRAARPLAWATWPTALSLLALVFAARLAYLVWLCPYELAGDEAYYWQQSRHLDACYNEKGPALPWMIAASCRAFGDTEWAVRLPVLLSFVVAAWAVGRLALAVTRGDERAGFLAVLCFLLIPAFQANAQICTQDGPLIALWVALTAIGLRLVRRWRDGRSTWAEWLLLWGTLGAGVLFKQSIVLFLMGFPIYGWLRRRSLRIDRTFFLQQLAGLALFALVVSPMVVWNQRHGWPLLAHTLGHVGAGGDQAGRASKGTPLTWVPSVVGGIVGAVGPAAVLLMLWAGRRAARERREDPARWDDRLWLLCASWPSVVFFVLLALVKPVIASWPLPSFAPLVVLVAERAVMQWRREPRESTARPREGAARPRATVFDRAWSTLVVYGVAGWLLLSFPNVLAELPYAGPRIQRSVLKRITGHREAAADVQRTLAELTPPGGQAPHVVTRYYMDAALLAFYLPDHPPVSTADRYMGRRSTTFDQWPDTSLDNPDLAGRSMLLYGKGNRPWEQALDFDEIRPVGNGRFLGVGYRGPRPGAPGGAGDDE